MPRIQWWLLSPLTLLATWSSHWLLTNTSTNSALAKSEPPASVLVANRSNCNATQEEQAALAYLNQARQNPQEIAQDLGIDLSGVTPRPPLVVDPILARVAKQRVEDFAARNYVAHVDPDGIGPNRKVADAGYPLPSFYLDNPANNFIESLWAGKTFGDSFGFPTSGAQAIAALLIDRGTSPPGHRIHLLGLNELFSQHTEVGIGYLCVTNGNETSYYMAVLTAYKDRTTSSLDK